MSKLINKKDELRDIKDLIIIKIPKRQLVDVNSLLAIIDDCTFNGKDCTHFQIYLQGLKTLASVCVSKKRNELD